MDISRSESVGGDRVGGLIRGYDAFVDTLVGESADSASFIVG